MQRTTRSPCAANLTGRATAAFASVPGDLKSTELGLGMNWGVAQFVELSGRDVVRHRIVGDIVDAYARHEEQR